MNTPAAMNWRISGGIQTSRQGFCYIALQLNKVNINRMKDTLDSMSAKYVSVRAPARLHLGFLDLHGGLDRKFGSLGLAVQHIDTTLIASYADDINVSGPGSERTAELAEQVLSHYGIDGGVRIEVVNAIPAHAGLGSGTQMSLAVATAITRLYGLSADTARQALILHRGARSGIGIGTFEYGGFIIDAGRGKDTEVPPVISQADVPEHWRILLVFDNGVEGINGVPERRAFNTLPPLDEDLAGMLCRLTMMQVLPAIAEDDCELFGSAITRIQEIIGDYFSGVQGGRYTSPFLADVLQELNGLGATGSGQSSWGPTGFAFFPNETSAFQALKKIRGSWQHESRLSFMMTGPCNLPASISETDSRPQLETVPEESIQQVKTTSGKS